MHEMLKQTNKQNNPEDMYHIYTLFSTLFDYVINYSKISLADVGPHLYLWTT